MRMRSAFRRELDFVVIRRSPRGRQRCTRTDRAARAVDREGEKITMFLSLFDNNNC